MIGQNSEEHHCSYFKRSNSSNRPVGKETGDEGTERKVESVGG